MSTDLSFGYLAVCHWDNLDKSHFTDRVVINLCSQWGETRDPFRHYKT